MSLYSVARLTAKARHASSTRTNAIGAIGGQAIGVQVTLGLPIWPARVYRPSRPNARSSSRAEGPCSLRRSPEHAARQADGGCNPLAGPNPQAEAASILVRAP